MKNSKKAQGISITTIIVAAIALIVLVVLIAVFTGRMGIWGIGLDEAGKGVECSVAGGDWKSQCGSTESQIFIVSDQKSHPNERCCKEATTTTDPKDPNE